MRRSVWNFIVIEESDALLLKHFCNHSIVRNSAWAKHNSGVNNYRPHYHFCFSLNQPMDCYEFTQKSGYNFEEEDIPSPSFGALLAYLKEQHTEQDVLVINGKRM